MPEIALLSPLEAVAADVQIRGTAAPRLVDIERYECAPRPRTSIAPGRKESERISLKSVSGDVVERSLSGKQTVSAFAKPSAQTAELSSILRAVVGPQGLIAATQPGAATIGVLVYCPDASHTALRLVLHDASTVAHVITASLKQCLTAARTALTGTGKVPEQYLWMLPEALRQELSTGASLSTATLESALKSESDSRHWDLRMHDTGGEPDLDFPPLERTRPIKNFSGVEEGGGRTGQGGSSKSSSATAPALCGEYCLVRCRRGPGGSTASAGRGQAGPKPSTPKTPTTKPRSASVYTNPGLESLRVTVSLPRHATARVLHVPYDARYTPGEAQYLTLTGQAPYLQQAAEMSAAAIEQEKGGVQQEDGNLLNDVTVWDPIALAQSGVYSSESRWPGAGRTRRRSSTFGARAPSNRTLSLSYRESMDGSVRDRLFSGGTYGEMEGEDDEGDGEEGGPPGSARGGANGRQRGFGTLAAAGVGGTAPGQGLTAGEVICYIAHKCRLPLLSSTERFILRVSPSDAARLGITSPTGQAASSAQREVAPWVDLWALGIEAAELVRKVYMDTPQDKESGLGMSGAAAATGGTSSSSGATSGKGGQGVAGGPGQQGRAGQSGRAQGAGTGLAAQGGGAGQRSGGRQGVAGGPGGGPAGRTDGDDEGSEGEEEGGQGAPPGAGVFTAPYGYTAVGKSAGVGAFRDTLGVLGGGGAGGITPWVGGQGVSRPGGALDMDGRGPWGPNSYYGQGGPEAGEGGGGLLSPLSRAAPGAGGGGTATGASSRGPLGASLAPGTPGSAQGISAQGLAMLGIRDMSAAAAGAYQEWIVVKINKAGKRQNRVLAIDGTRMYVRKLEKGGSTLSARSSSGEKEKEKERLISDLMRVEIPDSSTLRFTLFFRGQAVEQLVGQASSRTLAAAVGVGSGGSAGAGAAAASGGVSSGLKALGRSFKALASGSGSGSGSGGGAPSAGQAAGSVGSTTGTSGSIGGAEETRVQYETATEAEREDVLSKLHALLRLGGGAHRIVRVQG